jgi:hypothetical protein
MVKNKTRGNEENCEARTKADVNHFRTEGTKGTGEAKKTKPLQNGGSKRKGGKYGREVGRDVPIIQREL